MRIKTVNRNIGEIFPIGQNIIIHSFAEALQQKDPFFLVVDVMQGGMGGCIRLKAENCDEYALKIILPEKFESEDSLQRYLGELKKWCTFSMCDGILEAYEITKYNEIPCVISPWMKQGDLRSLMRIKERTVFFNSMHRIVGSLKWVYDKYKTIHRDLKPNNILVDSNYLPYIADWGLCKTLNESTDGIGISSTVANADYKTEDGFAFGTWGFASPEQMSGDANIDFRTDIFALGVIMYIWETGDHPFQGVSVQETINNVYNGRYKKLGGLFHRSNFGADKIITKCLENNSNDRYSSYDELLRDIELCAKGVPAFLKYEPKLRSYNDLINPITIGIRIRNNEIPGLFGKSGSIVTDQEYILDQIYIATNLAKIGECKKALELLSKITPPEDLLHKYPDLPVHRDFVINYASILSQNGQYDVAISWLLKIGHSVNLPAAFYVNLSLCYMNKGDMGKCLDTCNEGLLKYPNDVGILGNATLSATSLEKFSEALQCANKRIKLEQGLQTYYEYAFLCYKWGESLKELDFPQAIKLYKSSLLYYRKALEYNPKHYSSNINLGIVLFKLRRYTDSMEVLSQIDYCEASLFWMSKNMEWVSNFDECIKFCNKYLEKHPNFIMLQRVLSECIVDAYVLNKLHDGKRIIENTSWEFFNSMVNDKEHRVESDLRYYGRLLHWDGQVDTAIKFFKWAQLVFPKEWTYNYYLSYFLLMKKQYTEALEQAIIANKKAPWREKGYLLLSECYKVLGNTINSNKCIAKHNEIKKQKEDLYNSCKSI